MTRKGMSEERWIFLNAVKVGYSNRRPEEYIEIELADEPKTKRRVKCRRQGQ